MLSNHDEAFFRAAFAPIRDLEPDQGLLARVVAQLDHKEKPRPGFAAATAWSRLDPATPWLRFRPTGLRPRLALRSLATLALLGATLYSVPATRAAIEDAGGTVGGVFSGWLGGNHAEAPGKPLEAGEKLPEYMEYLHDTTEPRVIAEAGGYKLYSYIGPSGGLGFDLGETGIGMGFESAAELGDSALHVLGPGAMRYADSQGHVPLFGIAARSVSSVELTYTSGPPLRVDGVDGGFVLLAEPARGPVEVIALNANGEEVEGQLVDDSAHTGSRIDWSHYVAPSDQAP